MKNKTISSILAVTFAVTLIIIAGIGSSWFTNPNITTWFNSWGKGKDEEGKRSAPVSVKATAETFAEEADNGSIMPRSSIDEMFDEIFLDIQFNDKDARDVTASFASRIKVTNNINDQTTSNCYRVFYFASGVMHMANMYLFPDHNPFAELSGYKVESIEVARENGKVIQSFFDYMGAKVYSIDSYHQPSPSFVDIEIKYHLVENEKPVPLPEDPVKEGYTFTGWYFGTDSEHSEVCRRYDGSPITSDTALHAHFAVKKYIVSFDSAGGNEMEEQIVIWNTAATLPAPVREGYQFKGWYFADGTKYEDQPIKEDTVLTAQWEVKLYTVIFYVEGIEFNRIAVEYGSKLIQVAEELNLKMLYVSKENGEPIEGDAEAILVTDNFFVDAEKKSETEIKIDYMKENMWLMIGGIAGIVVLASVITAVCVGIKRKRKGGAE